MEPLTFRNAWIVSVKSARRHIGGWMGLGIAACALFLGLIAAPALHRIWANRYLPDAPPAALSRTLLYLGIFLPLYFCAFVSRFREIRAPIRAWFTGWNGLGLGTGIGAFAFLFTVLAASIFGVVRQGADPAGAGLGVALAAGLIGFQAFGEEVFFRGWLQPILAADWGVKIGLVVTAASFAAAHLLTQGLGAIAIVNIFIAGLMFGLLALRTGGLAAPFGAHWVWNWLEQSVMGLVPNPGVDSLGSFFDFDLGGPGLLSGGGDGLDGSLLVTLVLSAVVVGFLLVKPAHAQESSE